MAVRKFPAWPVGRQVACSVHLPWAPSLPFDQVLCLALLEPLLGDGLGGEYLVAQLVLLPPLHTGPGVGVGLDIFTEPAEIG